MANSFTQQEWFSFLEVLSNSMPKGFCLYDFGGTHTVMPVSSKDTSGTPHISHLIGIQRASDGAVQFLELK
jgi:hypothetical protein